MPFRHREPTPPPDRHLPTFHRPDPPEPAPQPEVLLLLERLAAVPGLREVRVGTDCRLLFHELQIGTVNLRTARFKAEVVPEFSGILRRRYPYLDVTVDELRLKVTDASSVRTAEAIVRWRVDFERFSWQLGEASP